MERAEDRKGAQTMEVVNERATGHGGISLRRWSKKVWVICILMVFVSLSVGYSTWALQRHTIDSSSSPGTSGAPETKESIPQSGAEAHGPAAAQAQPAHAAPPPGPTAAAVPPPQPHGAVPVPATSHELPVAAPSQPGHEAAGEHGSGAHGGHGPVLPEISPTPGVTFVETMINLLEKELYGRTLGWRPNDIIIGRFTDNINNYQLGVLEAMRFTLLRLKDSLTRMGDADTYDPDLEKALHLLMNSATLFWFPSAESSYGEAVELLKAFLEKLKTGKRSFYYRKDNLVALINNYRDLLGNVNKSLIVSGISWFQSDDYFYYAKGIAHAYYEILKVVRVGFQPQLASTLYGLDIMDEILHELYLTEQIDPWIILDSDLGGFFANHRANLNAPLSEVVHLMVVLGQL